MSENPFDIGTAVHSVSDFTYNKEKVEWLSRSPDVVVEFEKKYGGVINLLKKFIWTNTEVIRKDAENYYLLFYAEWVLQKTKDSATKKAAENLVFSICSKDQKYKSQFSEDVARLNIPIEIAFIEKNFNTLNPSIQDPQGVPTREKSSSPTSEKIPPTPVTGTVFGRLKENMEQKKNSDPDGLPPGV